MLNGALKSEIHKRFNSVCIRKMFIIFKCSDSHLGFLIVLKPGNGNLCKICQYVLNSGIKQHFSFC